MLKKGKPEIKPSGRLLELMNKYDIPVEVAQAIGEEAVRMAQTLFEKWKTNFKRAYKTK
ncbi:MAG: hypothetical protein NWF10_00550 [Candidatus Bathyarchaeota archaeon]|nr:hypothetical protein [Candidatus Bathyarchaeota archaeon]